MTPTYPHESDMHVRLDISDFYSNRDLEEYLDWVHCVETYFKWHEVLKRHRLQFAETNLKGTTLMWWQQYNESYVRANLGVYIDVG